MEYVQGPPSRSRRHGTRWANRDVLQQATKGRFALHSQTVQMVVHAFLGAIDSTRKRKPTHSQLRDPYKKKSFYPFLWPAQAMSVHKTFIVLPMGRGRSSVVLLRPERFPDTSVPAKIVWNELGYELHVGIEQSESAAGPGTNRATVDLDQIHQAAVTTATGDACVVSGRGIRSEKRRQA